MSAPQWREHLGTEFAQAMRTMVEAIPGAAGAVLTDGGGEPIDFVHRPDRLSELDLQIAGAQMETSLLRTHESAGAFETGPPVVMIECATGAVVGTVLADAYVLTLVIVGRANLARALGRVPECGAELATLL